MSAWEIYNWQILYTQKNINNDNNNNNNNSYNNNNNNNNNYNIPSKIDIYKLKVEKRAIKTYLQFNI